jgi:hypothetical protein
MEKNGEIVQRYGRWKLAPRGEPEPQPAPTAPSPFRAFRAEIWLTLGKFASIEGIRTTTHANMTHMSVVIEASDVYSSKVWSIINELFKACDDTYVNMEQFEGPKLRITISSNQ